MKRFVLFCSLLSTFIFLNAQVNITFQVDMSGETISGDGVHVAGDLNGWSTSDNQLMDQGNGIYMTTVSLDPGRDIKYKYLNGNAWGAEETPPSDCSIGGNDRIFTVPAVDDTLVLHAFSACPAVVKKTHVIFTVDMEGQTISADGLHIAGNFQAWDPGASLMVDNGDSTYSLGTDVLGSILTVQYKYVNGNAWGSEESIPSECSNTETNRFMAISGDTVILPTYKFGSCEVTSAATGLTDLLRPTVFVVSPSPASAFVQIELQTTAVKQAKLSVSDLFGRSFATETVAGNNGDIKHSFNVEQWPAGIYMVRFESEAGYAVKRFVVTH
ncbi:MAG: T9SS type A sorting domain-containing protein [Bacteroidia bacterium]